MPKIDLEVVGKDKASGKLKGITGSIIGAQLAVDALKKAFGFLTDNLGETITAASDLQETTGKFNVVFSDVKGEAESMAQVLAESFNLSKEGALDALSGTGDLLTGLGFTQESALGLSNTVAQLGADLASFSNYSGGTTGAIEALTKGLLGEREMMKGLGINITETDLKQRALAEGHELVNGQLDKTVRAQLTLQMAMEQSKNAIGDVARTSDSYANVMRNMQARVTDLQAGIGGLLLPILTDMAKGFTSVVEGITDFVTSSGFIANVAGSFEVLKTIFSGLVEVASDIGKEIGKTLLGGFKDLNKATDIANKKFDLLAAISQKLQSVLKVVGTVINALITNIFNFNNIIIEAIKVFGNFKDAITGKQKWGDAFKSIKNVGDAVKKYVVEGIGGTKDVFDSVFEEFKAFGVNVQIESDKYTTAFQDGYNSIISTVDNNPIEPKMIAPDMDSVVRDIRTQIEEVAVPEIKAKLEIDVSAIVSNIAGAIGGAFGGASGDFGLNFSGLEEDLANSEKQYNDRIEALKEQIEALKEQAENASDAEKERIDAEKERIKEQIKALEKQKEKEKESIQNEIDKLKELSEQRAEAGGLLGEITSGISAVVQGFASGGIVGGIIAAITVFMNLIKDGLAPTIDELAPFLDVLLEQFVTLGMQVGRFLAPNMKILLTILIVVNTLLEVFLPLLIALQFPLEVLAGLLIHIVNPLREVNKQLQAFAQWINDTIGAVNDALGGGGGGGGGNWWDNPFGFQHGGEFTVPAGYPNDSFKPNIALTSGERVTVTPAGQSSRGEMTMIFNIGEIRDRETADYFAGQVMQLYEQEASR